MNFKSSNGTHIHRYRYTQKYMPRLRCRYYFTFCTFGLIGIHAKNTNFIFGTPQTYIDTVTYRYTHTCACTQAHTETYTDTCMFVHTHIDVHMGNVRTLLLQSHFKAKMGKNCYFLWGL